MVGPREEREAVRVARQEGNLSERHACGLIGMHRGSWRYRRSQPHDAELRARLRELAEERVRFGYRRLWAMLRRERNADGTRRWVVNHKRVHRIYREEGLAMRRKQTKRLRAMARTPLELPTRANQVWTMDFTKDRLASGRNFRTLNLMDGCTREALWIEVDTSLPGERVVRVLEWLKQNARSAGGDSSGQRAGVHQPGVGSMGFCERSAVAFHRAGQAGAKCVHRKFQREVPRRMSEPELVCEPGRS